MGKLTQKDLLEEGFLDTMRALGKASVTAAKSFAPELTQPLGGIIEPFKKTYETFKLNRPISFVKDKLKKEYYRTFYTKSLRNFKEYQIPGEPKKGGKKGVSFEAIRMTTPQPITGSAPASPPETYYAIITKGPEGFEMEVRDGQNKKIAGEKETKKATKKFAKPKWDEEYSDSGLPTNPTYSEVRAWLLDYLPKSANELSNRFGSTDIDTILQNIIQSYSATGTTGITNNTQLQDADIEGLKKGLKSYRIFENSQIDTLKQLKLFVESVNS